MDDTGGYDDQFFNLLQKIEDRHFWFKGRARIVSQIAQQLARGVDKFNVLELGCGNGGMLKALQSACPTATVVGMDLFLQGLRNARESGARRLVCGDARQTCFAPVFDLIGLFDVIEHIPEDVEALRGAARLLAPGGAILITVPAHPKLWSYFDTASRHCRRYTPESLRESIEGAGLRVEYLTQFMAALYPIMRLTRWLGGKKQNRKSAAELAREELRIVPGVNGILNALMAAESKVIARRRRLPIGTSLLAIARKEQTRAEARPTGDAA